MQAARNPVATQEDEEERRRKREEAFRQEALEIGARLQNTFNPNRTEQQFHDQADRVASAFSNPQSTLTYQPPEPQQQEWIPTVQFTQPQNAQQSLLWQEDPNANKWYKGDQPTSSEILAQIYRVGSTDSVKGRALFDQFTQLQKDPTSPIYEPYSTGTNYAIKALSDLGVDMSGGVTQEWLNTNQGYLQYLKYNQAGNIQAPTKRSKKEEKIGYQVYQLMRDEEQTTQAEAEWQALKEDVSYWAGRKDLNLSDEQILDKIDWKNKYKTLAKMDESRAAGNPLSLNRAVGYNQDALSGVIWAARNGITTDDGFNSVRAALGQGRQWEPNEVSDRLDPNSQNFNPYCVSTLSYYTDKGLYFGADSFDREWTTQNRGYRTSSDVTAQKNFDQVWDAEQTTLKAEEELEQLNNRINERLKYYSDPDKVLSGLLDDFPTLKKMDDTLHGGDILMTTRAIDFSRAAIEQRVRDECLKNNVTPHAQQVAHQVSFLLRGGGQWIQDMGFHWPGQAADAANETAGNNINAAGDTILNSGTPAEKVVWEAGYSPTQEQDMSSIADSIDSEMIDGQASYDYVKGQADQQMLDNYLPAYSVSQDKKKAEAKKAEAERNLWLLSHGIIPEEDTIGQFGKGNIDLYNRPTYTQEDGSVSTVNSIGIYDEKLGKEVLIPTIIDGKQVSDREAEDHYYETGEYLGMFDTPEEADAYAVDLHKQQEKLYPSETPRTGASRLPEGAIVLGAAGASDTASQLPPGMTQAEYDRLRISQGELPVRDQQIHDLTIQYQNQLNDANSELESRADEFAAADKELADLKSGYDAADQIRGLTGAEKGSGYDMQTAMNAYYELGAEYVKTDYSAYSLYDAALMDGEKFEDVLEAAKIGKVQYQQEIDYINQVLDFLDKNNYDFSDQYFNNVMRRRKYLEQQVKAADYFMLQTTKGFSDVVKEEKEKINAAWENGGAGGWFSDVFGNGSRGEYSKLDRFAADPMQDLDLQRGPSTYMLSLTDTERDTYLYLRATQGEDAAKEYYDYLTNSENGVVVTRSSEAASEAFRKLGEARPITGTLLSVIASPLGIAGSAYSLIAKLRGEEINPYSGAFVGSNFSSNVRGGAKATIDSKIDEKFGKDSPLHYWANLGYDAVTSAGDSLMNAYMFGGGLSLGEAQSALGKFGLKATESLISAAPMGIQAAGSAIQEAKLRGATDEQALMMGGMTFVCETITEAVTLENIGESFNFGQAADFKSWLFNAATKYLDEPLAEGVNEIMESLGDDLIMGELSNRNQRVQELMKTMSREEAEKQAWSEFWGDVGNAALTGFVSSQVSSGLSYAGGRLTHRNTKQNTTPEQREATVDERGNVAEVDTSDNSVQQAQERAENIEQVDQNGNVAEPDTSDNSVQQAQEVAENIEQVDQNGNVAEPDTSDNSVQQAQERAENIAKVDENGNVAEPDTSDNSVQQAQEVVENIEKVDANGNVAEPTEPTPVNRPRKVASQLTALGVAQTGDQASQAATMGAILLPSGKRKLFGTGTASAAAQYFSSRYGTQAVTTLRDSILVASENNIPVESVTEAIAHGALAEEGTAPAVALENLVQNGVTPENLALLTAAHQNEMQNPASVAAMRAKVKDNMIANRVKAHVANGEAKAVAPYEQQLESAKQEQENANKALENAQKTQEQMQENLAAANEEFIADPGNDTAKNAVTQATHDLEGQIKVVDEYSMRADNAEAGVKNAQNQLDQARDETLAPIRQQATAEVEQALVDEAAADEQERAAEIAALQAAAQAEAEAQAAAEEQARQEKEAEKAKKDYEKAVKKTPPKVPFGHAVQANLKSGRPIQLTGVAYTDGSTTYYTTQDGKVISQNQLENGQQFIKDASENWGDEEWDAVEGAAPTVPLDKSITVTNSKGTTQEVIGILSANPNGDEIIVQLSNGKTADWNSLTPMDQHDSRVFGDLYEQNEKKLQSQFKQQAGGKLKAAKGALPTTGTSGVRQSGEVKSGQDIIHNLASAIGMQEDNRFKKYLRRVRKTTRGYTLNNGVIHVLDAQDVKAAVHEIGHNLDERLGMQAMFPDLGALRSAYERIYGTTFLNQYKPNEVPGELMAEFTRTWLQDRATAVDMAGEDAVRKFETALRENGYLDAMKQAATDFHLYDLADAVAREEAMIKMDGPEKARKSISERAKDFATKWADGTIQFLDVTNAVKKAQGDRFNYADDTRTLLLANPNVIGNFTESTLYGSGMVDIHGDQIINEKTGEAYGSLSDIFEKVNRKDVKKFIDYWVALHAQDRNKVNKAVLSNDVDTNEVISRLGKEHSDWAGIIDEFEDWYGAFMQSWLVDTGRLSQEAFDTMRKMYPHYIPTFRVNENSTQGSGSSQRTDAVPDSGVRRAKGGTQNIDNPVAHIAEYVQSYISNMKQVEALRAFDGQMRYLTNNSLETAALAEPAQPDVESEYRGRANKENRQAVEAALNGLKAVGHISDHDAQIILDFMDEVPDTAYVVKDRATGNDVLNIPMEDGSIHSWTVYNPEIVKALMRTSNPANTPIIARVIGKLTRFLCSNATSRSIPFVTQNFMSDTETAANTGRGSIIGNILPVYALKQLGTAAKLLHDEIAATAVGEKLNLHKSEDYRQFRLFGQLGHRYTFRNSDSRADLTNKLFGGRQSAGEYAKRFLTAPVTTIEKLSEFFEDVTRYNEFLHTGDDRSTYEGRLRAGQNSREATTDFSKHGTATDDLTFVNKIIPFFNSSIQGVYKTARMFSSENEGNRVKTLARIGINSVFTSAVLAAIRNMFFDDKDKEAYDQLSDYEKSRYWDIKLPSGKYFRIKRSQDGFIQIADAIGDFIGNVFTGYEGDELGSLAGLAREVANNIMIDVGTGFAPFIDASNNKTWYGGQIEDARMQKRSTGARYDEDMRLSTRLLSYMANAFGADFSPLDIEYIENQYLGSMGSLGSGIFDVVTGDQPTGGKLWEVFTDHLNKKFLVDPVYSNNLSSMYYDGRKWLNEVVEDGKAGLSPEHFRYGMTEDEIDAAYKEASELVSSDGAVGKAYTEISKLWKKHGQILEDENLTPAEQEAQAREIRAGINKEYIKANAIMADFRNKYGYSNGLEQNVMNALNLFTGQKGDGIKSIQETEKKDAEWEAYTNKAVSDRTNPMYAGWAKEYRNETDKDLGPKPNLTPEFDDVAYEVKKEDWNEYVDRYMTQYNKYLDDKSRTVIWDELDSKDKKKLLQNAKNSANNAARNWLKEQEKYGIPKK